MYPGEETQADKLPGISAVLAVTPVMAQQGSTQLDSAILDLAAVLDGLVSQNFEIIVVAPTHADALLDGLRVRFPALPVRLQLGKVVGHEAALAAGFDAAAYDLILVTGTNGEIDVRETNHFLEAIERGADLAIGYRARRADGLVRRLYGWGWNALVSLLFGKTGRDVDCPFKLFRTVVWQRVGVHPRGPGPNPTFNAELLIRARRLGFNVAEVPVRHRTGVRRDAAGPTEIGRALVALGELRRGVEGHGWLARGHMPVSSLHFAHSAQVAPAREQPHAQESHRLSPDV